MKRLSVRLLLVGVAGASLLAPLIALLALRSFDSALVLQTERELNAQGALIAQLYQENWAAQRGVAPGNPRARAYSSHSFTPFWSRIDDLDEFAPPAPEQLPVDTTALALAQTERWQHLSRVLRSAQIFNLSGVRVLDQQGCALSSSREQLGGCFSALPEVRGALSGRDTSVLRPRVSDEPPPPITSLRRRGDLRVFVALPVWNDGQVIGAVLLSRTAESGLEWLFKQRRDIFYGGALVLGATLLVSLLFSWLITRPLREMSRRLGSAKGRLSEVRAPREIHALGVALDQKTDELQRRTGELQRRTGELEDKTVELEEKSRYVAEFAANVSHELKTPLTSIRGAVELLRDGASEMDAVQRERFLRNIDAASERTERLVTRLLQLARLETGQSEGDEEVPLSRWLATLPDRYGDAVKACLRGDGERKVSVTAIDSVVGNLVDNALRYRRSAPVQLTIDVGDLVHVAVVDDGPGISDENRAHLFERFFTTERDRGGTGLGLSIVQAVAERHGGKIEVTSSPKGTRVEVWF